MNLNKKISSLLVASCISLTSLSEASADIVAPSDDTKSLNLRSEACTSAERITGIPNGSEMMRIMSCENNWDIVVYKNNIGYVCRDYLKVVSNDPNPYSVNPMEFTVMATDKVRMRLGPGTEFPVIGSIGLGDIATVKGVSNEGWVLLTYNDKMGFVSSEYLKTIDEVALAEEHEEYFVQTHPNVYTVSSVNLRKGPGTEYEKYKSLDSGVKLDVVGYEKGFYKVIYHNNVYYVSAEFVATNPNSEYRDDIIKVVYATSPEVNVRSESNTTSSVLYVLDEYEICEVLGETNDYYMIRVNNLVGYVSKNYVKPVNNTFIVIDISEQKLTLYDNNQVYLETDVVTGQKGSFDTPRGMYTIGTKERDKVLRSEKYGYERPVEYWIPVNGGVGIHDAKWRKSFGDSIYERDGSHGCINVSLKQTKKIYERVKSRSTKVFIHK